MLLLGNGDSELKMVRVGVKFSPMPKHSIIKGYVLRGCDMEFHAMADFPRKTVTPRQLGITPWLFIPGCKEQCIL
jgi:hypothetical protein